MFGKQIGKNMEVYVNDMLVKSKEAKTHLEDLQETFDTLRKYRMKFNPMKCVFGFCLENSLVSWCLYEELKKIQRRSESYLT